MYQDWLQVFSDALPNVGYENLRRTQTTMQFHKGTNFKHVMDLYLKTVCNSLNICSAIDSSYEE